MTRPPELEGGVLPPYETVFLASLVEKETKLAEEQPKVAGVYKKRLDLGMRLQCDPTSLYARWLSGNLRFTGRWRKTFVTPTGSIPTRRLAPPTPIAIPSATAIEAAKAPLVGRTSTSWPRARAATPSRPSLRDHNQNVGAYRKELARQKRAVRG